MTTNQVAPISAVSGELLTKTYERRPASSGNLSFKPRGCTSFYNAMVTAATFVYSFDVNGGKVVRTRLKNKCARDEGRRLNRRQDDHGRSVAR